MPELTPTRIRVEGAQPYDVVVGTGLLGELDDLLKGSDRVGVIHPASLRATAEAIQAELGGEVHLIEVPGEYLL